MTDIIGYFGGGEYGAGPYGGAFPPYGLAFATALNTTLVRVTYTQPFDPWYPLLVAESNYVISPPLVIYNIIHETAQTVLLITSPQSVLPYTVTIGAARGLYGQSLDPSLATTGFTGVSVSATFHTVATSRRRVRAIFSEAMLQNSALTNPTKYSLTELDGTTPIAVSSVDAEQSSHVTSVVLTLGANLVSGRFYCLTISSDVVTEVGGYPLSPDTSVLQWIGNAGRLSIPIDMFTGEVQNGLYGIHGGLVFFSPALITAAADSVIQVDSVSVCSKAFDEYHFPQPIDPPVFYTHGSSITPTPQVTTLNSTAVLWAQFPRLVEARFELENRLSDTVPTPVSGPCTATFTEPWDLSFVSLLNNISWKLFDNAGTPPAYFITANNLGPIPPGATTTVVLE